MIIYSFYGERHGLQVFGCLYHQFQFGVFKPIHQAKQTTNFTDKIARRDPTDGHIPVVKR